VFQSETWRKALKVQMLAAVTAHSSITQLLREPMSASVQNLRTALDEVAGVVAAVAAATPAPVTKEFVDSKLVPALQGAAAELTAAFSQQKQRGASRQWMDNLDISSDDEEKDGKEAANESKRGKHTYASPFGLKDATWKKEAQRVLDNYLLVHKVLHHTYTNVCTSIYYMRAYVQYSCMVGYNIRLSAVLVSDGFGKCGERGIRPVRMPRPCEGRRVGPCRRHAAECQKKRAQQHQKALGPQPRTPENAWRTTASVTLALCNTRV
jgi:hypothetical protein